MALSEVAAIERNVQREKSVIFAAKKSKSEAMGFFCGRASAYNCLLGEGQKRNRSGLMWGLKISAFSLLTLCLA